MTMTYQSKKELLRDLLLDNIGSPHLVDMTVHKLLGGHFRLLFWGAQTHPKRRITVFFYKKITDEGWRGALEKADNISGLMVGIRPSRLLSIVEELLQLGLVHDYPE